MVNPHANSEFEAGLAEHMDLLFIFGMIVACAGLTGVLYCIAAANRHRKSQLGDAELRSKLDRLVHINLISFMLAVFGGIAAVAGLLF